jgi:short-subunit dehydrogenase involved in D-alanine esterification of teichoic acids
VIYGMPMTIEFVLALREQLKNGKIDVREIVPIQETEEDFEEEQQPVRTGLRGAAGQDVRSAELRSERSRRR